MVTHTQDMCLCRHFNTDDDVAIAVLQVAQALRGGAQPKGQESKHGENSPGAPRCRVREEPKQNCCRAARHGVHLIVRWQTSGVQGCRVRDRNEVDVPAAQHCRQQPKPVKRKELASWQADRACCISHHLDQSFAGTDDCLGLLSTPWQAGGSALVPLLLLLLLLLPGPPSEVHHDPAVVADAERHPDGRLVVAVTAIPISRLVPADLP